MAPSMSDMTVGSQGKDTVSLGAIVPAPGPPVCQEEYVPENDCMVPPNA